MRTPSLEIGSGSARGLIHAALIAFAPLAIAAALTGVVALADGTSFAHVNLLPSRAIPAWRFGLALVAAIAGYLGVYFAPGLLLMRTLGLRLPNAVANLAAAFVLSLLAVSLAWIAAQAATAGIAGRSCLYLTVAALDVAALVAGLALAPGAPALPELPAKAKGTGAGELLVPIGGVLLLIAAVWLFMPGKIAIEALEGDATEVHGFAQSLMVSALPEWDLESGAWGFYPTFMFVSYPVFFSLALVGGVEAAVRLPALLFLGMMVIATADLAARGRTRFAGGSLNVLIPILVTAYLSAQVGAYYAGYHPFHGDLGCSPLEEWIVTALAMCAFLLLRDGASGLAAVAALLSILAFPSGLMFAGLIGVVGLVVGRFEERRVLWRFGLAMFVLLLVYAIVLVIYTVNTGTFDAMMGEWFEKYFRGRASFAAESVSRMAMALGWFVLLCGGLPFLAVLVAPFRADRVTRWMALVTLAWVGFFLASPNKNIHYFMPAALLPMGVAMRIAAGWSERPRLSLGIAGALSTSAMICIVLCAPEPVPPYVADREFGRRTVFLARNERQAVDYSRVIHNVMPPLWTWKPGDPWSIGYHTWVLYSSRRYEFDRPYDFYVGTGPAPVEGVTEVTSITTPSGEEAKLWVRGGRATLRDWKSREYPLRERLSRFDFDMTPGS
ncbi:hypothetical protein K8I85_10725 [bacterium]|nr:hypothetical protein [bacterium]